MHPRRHMARNAVVAALAAAALLVGGFPAQAAPAPTNPLPVFEFQGVITDKEKMQFNPTNEYIFPSAFHAGAHIENPLGEWYLYFAPHDNPGGIALMYGDSPAGPWTEFADNPIIENEWLPHYAAVPHVSSPDAFWNEEEQKLFVYYHGDNGTTRFATTTDGYTFEYGGVAVTNAEGGPGTTETSYARVFEHPDPDSEFGYAMFYMDNTQPNIRRIRLAESVDGRQWQVRPTPVVIPGAVEGQNVSGGNLWEWDGQLYVIYHASSGTIYARTIDKTLTQVGQPLELFKSSGVGADVGRAAAPDIVTAGNDTYLFYESGDRLGATIAWAKLNPDAVRPEEPGADPDPLRANCQGANSDEFSSTELDRATWPTVLRESAATHSIVDGALRIPTYRSGIAGAPLVQQPVPAGAWEVTTEVSVDPSATYQQAGLLLYRDDANYAKFDLTFGIAGQRIEFILRTNGSDRNTGADSFAPPTGLGETFWLRMSSDGTVATTSLSVDGVTFEPVGRSVNIAALAPTAIGPFAIRGTTSAPEITADFGFFRWTPTAAEVEVCEAPEPPVDSETKAPARASLSTTSGRATGLHDGTFDVTMNLWWGANGSTFRLFENGVLASEQPLALHTPAAQQAVVQVAGKPNGEYVYTGELVNSKGTTATGSVTVRVADANPAVPRLSHNNWDGDGAFTVTANLWWGTNATSYRFFENGVLVDAGALPAASPAAQAVTLNVAGKAPGAHEYRVEFANAAGVTSSAALTVPVR
jgi:regulation of enolase protein 1 (concanavalin A-like superfamily)